MNLSKLKLSITLLCSMLLVACAGKPISPLAFNQNFLEQSPATKKVAVYVDKMPEPDISYPGASCLLCLGAAAAMNNTLTSHVDTLDVANLDEIAGDMVALLKAKGLDAFVVNEEIDLGDLKDIDYKDIPNSARTDHTLFKDKFGATHSLIVDLQYVGLMRNYSSYIPTSDPYAQITGSVYLVDNQSNIFDWYAPISTVSYAEGGVWDEPDEFPGLTTAYYENLEKTRELVLAPLKK